MSKHRNTSRDWYPIYIMLTVLAGGILAAGLGYLAGPA